MKHINELQTLRFGIKAKLRRILVILPIPSIHHARIPEFHLHSIVLQYRWLMVSFHRKSLEICESDLDATIRP